MADRKRMWVHESKMSQMNPGPLCQASVDVSIIH